MISFKLAAVLVYQIFIVIIGLSWPKCFSKMIYKWLLNNRCKCRNLVLQILSSLRVDSHFSKLPIVRLHSIQSELLLLGVKV